MKRFENKVAVITGAGDGIGLHIAQSFAAEGATVVIAEIKRFRASAPMTKFGRGWQSPFCADGCLG